MDRSYIKLFIYVVIAAAIVVAGIFYFTRNHIRPGQEVLLTPNPKIHYSVYSLGGRIITLGKNQFTMNSPEVFQTSNGNIVKNVLKTVQVNSSTQYTAPVTIKNPSFSSLKAGMQVVVYYSTDPTAADSTLANKVAIQK